MSVVLPITVYMLCLLTSVLCAFLLARSYLASRTRMLFWSALCFVFLALNNLVVVIDLVLLPQIDLSLLRHLLALGAILVLLVGFIWGQDE